jgi:hypothetical protein
MRKREQKSAVEGTVDKENKRFNDLHHLILYGYEGLEVRSRPISTT